MQKISLYLGFIALLVVSCKEEEASCPKGYFGRDCSEAFNNPFAGAWETNETCNGDSDSYEITLTPDASERFTFTVDGLWDEPGAILTLVIDESNRLAFTGGLQPLGNSGFNIEILSGTINSVGNQMTINFKIYSANFLVTTCAATCTK